MTLEKMEWARGPSKREIISFVRNEAHERTLQEVRKTPFLVTEGRTLRIAPGTPWEVNITAQCDLVTTDHPAGGRDIRLISRGESVFRNAIVGMIGNSRERILQEIRETLGQIELEEDIQDAIDESARGVVAKAHGCYPGKASVAGGSRLHELLGREKANRTIAVGGANANLNTHNLMLRYPEIIMASARANPNALSMWLNAGKEADGQVPVSSKQILQDAKEQFRGDQEDREYERTWRTFSKLNERAVRDYLREDSLDRMRAVAMVAARDNLNPSYTVLREILTGPEEIYAGLEPEGVREDNAPARMLALVLSSHRAGARNANRKMTQAEVAKDLRKRMGEISGHGGNGLRREPAERKNPRERKSEHLSRNERTREILAGDDPGRLLLKLDGAARVILHPKGTVEMRISGKDTPVLSVSRQDDGAILAEGDGFWTPPITLPGPGDQGNLSTRGAWWQSAWDTAVGDVRSNWTEKDGEQPNENQIRSVLEKILDEAPPEWRLKNSDLGLGKIIRECVQTLVNPRIWREARKAGAVTTERYNRTLREMTEAVPAPPEPERSGEVCPMAGCQKAIKNPRYLGRHTMPKHGLCAKCARSGQKDCGHRGARKTE